jgi:proline dehydrogenase
MRRLLLWASRQRWLAEQMTRRAFARRAVRRFMPGEDVDAALAAAQVLRAKRLSTVLTQLGENITQLAEAERVAEHYRSVLSRSPAGLDTQISVKLTQLGLDVSRAETVRHVRALARRAADAGTFVWIDMEDSSYTDATLDVYRQVRREHANVGVCLQAYLRRTAADLDALKAIDPSIRLVKGAYSEPAAVAFPSKREVDDAYFRLAQALLRSVVGRREARVGFGTHDMALIGRIQRAAGELAVSRDAFEVQMLYGIRRPDQDRLAAEGYHVRVLISYGAYWFPWYMRRLAERPANVWFVVRSLFG